MVHQVGQLLSTISLVTKRWPNALSKSQLLPSN
ncbi:hypothetical protein T06_2584 [Trichinella sp. T6]|nr:hypothetical protein T06_2584 [Trichinella sp. T6]